MPLWRAIPSDREVHQPLLQLGLSEHTGARAHDIQAL